MSLEFMAIVLFAAVLHAVWNALVRGSFRKYQDTVLIVLGAAVWTATLLPLAPIPAVESWPYLAASVLMHKEPKVPESRKTIEKQSGTVHKSKRYRSRIVFERGWQG